MFVDASALVAIIGQEANHEAVAGCLRKAPRPITSGLAVFEAALAVARLKALPPEIAEAAVDDLIEATGIILVPIAATESRLALAAHARYGKGRGHPARLNLGDCFAYACARVHGVSLLFVGDDFTQTDIRPALA